jgi:hypothetical protein
MLKILQDRPMPTFSAWDRVMKCGAEQHLPHVYGGSDAAELGTAVHLLLEHAYKSTLQDIHACFDEARAIAVKAYPQHADVFDAICANAESFDLANGWHTEAPVVLDISTMKVRSVTAHAARDYGERGPYEIAGTVDLYRVGDKYIELRDWKTGRQPPRAAASWQLRLGALALALVHGAETVTVEIGSFTETWEPVFDSHVYQRADLLEYAARIHAKAVQLRGDGVADVYTGPWCTFCPAMLACPGIGGLMRQATDPDGAVDRFRVLMNADRVKAYEAWRVFAMIASRMEAEVKNAARLEDIRLGNGKVYGYREKTVRDIEGTTTYKVLCERYGEAHAQKAVKFTTSQAAVEAAVKSAKEAGHPMKSMAAESREIMAAIDLVGGVVKHKRGEVREVNE